MTVRQALVIAAIAAGVTGLGIALLDEPIARLFAARDLGPLTPVFERGLDGLDRATAMLWPRGRLATLLIVAGAIAWRWRPRAGHALLLLGLTHAVSRNGGGYLKEAFGRLRPGQALARGDLGDAWFHDGFAFPSGHVAHYAALAFALALVFPRTRWPAMAVVVFVATARLGANAHWLSDVTGSIAIAAAAAAGLHAMLSRLRAGTQASGARPPRRRS